MNPNLAREFIYQEICAQPAIARHHVERQPPTWPTVPGRTLITGAGDSLCAAELLRDVFPRLRLLASPAMAASEAARGLGPDDALIAISASGRTPRVVEAALRARAAGARVVAVTDDPRSPITEHAHQTWWIAASPAEALTATAYATEAARQYVGYHHDVAQTKTALAIVLTIARAVAFRSDAGGPAVDWERLVTVIEKLCTDTFARPIDATARDCAASGQAFFLGSGASLALARFAAYKMFEFDRFAHFADIEEYCHTHYFVTRTRDAVVFLLTDDAGARRAAEIAPVLCDLFDARVVSVRADDVDRPAGLGGAEIVVPAGREALARHVAVLIALEWLTYLWGRVGAPDVNTFHAGYDTERLIGASLRTIRRSRIVP